MTTRWPRSRAYASAASSTASAPASSITLRVRKNCISGSFRAELCGPDRVVGGDEEGALGEGEVHGSGELDLVDLLAVGREDLYAAEAGDVDAAVRVHLDPIGKPRRDRGEEAAVGQALAVHDV